MSRRSKRRVNPTLGVVAVVLLTLWQGTSLVSQAPTQPTDPAGAVRRLIDAGTYQEAEFVAIQLSSTAEAQHGPQSIELSRALDLLVEALIKNGRASDPRSLSFAERAVALKDQHLGSTEAEIAVSLHNLGTLRQQRGELSTALSLHERGLRIRLASPGQRDSDLADSYDYVALAQIQLQQFKEAKRRLEESAVIRERHATDAPLALARTLDASGLLYRSAGPFAEAVAPLERALSVRRAMSSNHPDTVTTLRILGDVRMIMGDPARASDAWVEAVRLAQQTLRADHPVFADLLRRQGLLAFARGDLAESLKDREESLRIGELSLAPCAPTLISLLNDLANSYHVQGEYAKARMLYRRATATIEKCSARTPSSAATDSRATAYYNQALLAQEIGDYSEAERLLKRAIDTWSKGLGANHSFVATGLDSLAALAEEQKQSSRARQLYQQALEIRRRNLGPDHPDVASSIARLARIAADVGDVSLATRYVDQAIEIYHRVGAGQDPDHLAVALTLKAQLQTRSKDLVTARATFAEALTLRERTFGPSHPIAAESRAALAAADFALGAASPALQGALGAERAGRDHLRFTVRYLPERQAMSYAAKRPHALDLALSVLAADPGSDATTVLDAAIQSRGVVLDELAARARLGAVPDSGAASLSAAATRARERFANLVVRSLQSPVTPAMLEEARQQKEDAERALAEQSAEARAELQQAHIGWEQVHAALPADTAMVSYVKYNRIRTPAAQASTSLKSSPSYGAFVYRAGTANVVFIALGTTSSIDRLVKAWRVQADGSFMTVDLPRSEATRVYRAAAIQLRRAIWDPIEPHLVGTKRTFVVLDGLLNTVNLAALVGDDGRYLIERDLVLHYLSTERDIVNSQGQTTRTSLFAVGGPTFGGPAEKSGTPMRGSGCDLASVTFEPLPGSLKEVTAIRASWPARGADDVVVLSGAAATETAVKQSIAGKRVVHLSTHGFFLGSDCSLSVPGTRAIGGLTTSAKVTHPSTVVENPLLLSGLAFAGANRKRRGAADRDDGILTAEEIAGLNLQGTEWAVLSACDTGLGEIKAGEGVFGLRRAFQVAGARTVIMSLWSVEDRSTTEWMRALYEGRFRRGLETADAVREASLTVLRDRRARGQSTHPFFWAGFVASGDWR